MHESKTNRRIAFGKDHLSGRSNERWHRRRMRDFFIIVGCWAISFLFNGIETGLTSIDPVRLRHHVKLNRPAAVRLDRLLKKPERLLVTVLLITNLADILALLLVTRLFVSRFGSV